jgi:hypothetical protein
MFPVFLLGYYLLVLLVSSRWCEVDAPGGDQSKLDQGLHFFPVRLEKNSWGYLVLK